MCVQDEIHLTTGMPLAPVDWRKVDPSELKDGVGAPDLNHVTHQESHHQSYHYGQDHAAWQGHSQGVRRGSQSHTQYHGYQHYYANYTNYYSQYYQNYYSQLANKSAVYHQEKAHHFQDKNSVSGHYQSHYVYQGQASRQSELRPPAYFYNPHEESFSKTPPNEETNDAIAVSIVYPIV
ncbi:hypothetical protein J6590_075963 [Homalodisca vitripennis]|nr:hypothetical protein J6590_075963 [Homalodisca vitripennis]